MALLELILYTPTSTAPAPASAPATSQPRDLRDSPCVVVNRSKVMPRRCQVPRACSGSSGTTAASRFKPNHIFHYRTHRHTAGSAPTPAHLSRSAQPPAPRVLSPDQQSTHCYTVRLCELCVHIYIYKRSSMHTRTHIRTCLCTSTCI